VGCVKPSSPPLRIRAEAVDQNVDIEEDQAGGLSSKSCRAAESSRSSPGHHSARRGSNRREKARRLAPEGRVIDQSPQALFDEGGQRDTFGSLCFARRTSSSGSRTAVRSIICHDMSGRRRYVRHGARHGSACSTDAPATSTAGALAVSWGSRSPNATRPNSTTFSTSSCRTLILTSVQFSM